MDAATAPTRIDFDGPTDGTLVTNQCAGPSFSAINGGNPLAVVYNFSQGGPSVLLLAGGLLLVGEGP